MFTCKICEKEYDLRFDELFDVEGEYHFSCICGQEYRVYAYLGVVAIQPIEMPKINNVVTIQTKPTAAIIYNGDNLEECCNFVNCDKEAMEYMRIIVGSVFEKRNDGTWRIINGELFKEQYNIIES